MCNAQIKNEIWKEYNWSYIFIALPKCHVNRAGCFSCPLVLPRRLLTSATRPLSIIPFNASYNRNWYRFYPPPLDKEFYGQFFETVTNGHVFLVRYYSDGMPISNQIRKASLSCSYCTLLSSIRQAGTIPLSLSVWSLSSDDDWLHSRRYTSIRNTDVQLSLTVYGRQLWQISTSWKHLCTMKMDTSPASNFHYILPPYIPHTQLSSSSIALFYRSTICKV